MNVTAKISSEAQAILPKAVREKLGLKPGDTIRFRETEQGVVIEKLDLHLDDEDWGTRSRPSRNGRALRKMRPGKTCNCRNRPVGTCGSSLFLTQTA